MGASSVCVKVESSINNKVNRIGSIQNYMWRFGYSLVWKLESGLNGHELGKAGVLLDYEIWSSTTPSYKCEEMSILTLSF